MTGDPPTESAARARRHVHLCLAGVIALPVAAGVGWLLVAHHLRGPRGPDDDGRWVRRLVALAVVDTLAAIIAIAFATGALRPVTDVAAPTPSRPGVRIGAMPATDAGGPPRIGQVLAGAPAERAGLRPGDLIVAIDGEPVATFAQAGERIAASAPGEVRVLRVERDGQRLDVPVTPEARPADGELFRPWIGSSCGLAVTALASSLLPQPRFWFAAVLMLGTWLYVRRRRGPQPPLWRWVVVALVGGGVISGSVFVGACRLLGGMAPGVPLLALQASQLVTLVVATIAVVRMRRQGLLEARREPVLGAGRAFALGGFYVLTLVPRLHLLITGVESFARLAPTVSPLREVSDVLASWDARVLLVVSAVVLAPIAEEILFRGLILPRLYAMLGERTSLVVSSALFASLHFGYGIHTSVVFLLSLILGWARLRTGGLGVPIALHAASNALASIALLRA